MKETVDLPERVGILYFMHGGVVRFGHRMERTPAPSFRREYATRLAKWWWLVLIGVLLDALGGVGLIIGVIRLPALSVVLVGFGLLLVAQVFVAKELWRERNEARAERDRALSERDLLATKLASALVEAQDASTVRLAQYEQRGESTTPVRLVSASGGSMAEIENVLMDFAGSEPADTVPIPSTPEELAMLKEKLANLSDRLYQFADKVRRGKPHFDFYRPTADEVAIDLHLPSDEVVSDEHLVRWLRSLKGQAKTDEHWAEHERVRKEHANQVVAEYQKSLEVPVRSLYEEARRRGYGDREFESRYSFNVRALEFDALAERLGVVSGRIPEGSS